MPDVPIVDAHLHLWDPTYFRMAWLDGHPLLDRAFRLADYREHTQDISIDAMVYVEVMVAPAYALLEAQWAADRAREETRLQGIVAWAPLEYGEQARAFLEAVVGISPLLKGIRRIIALEPDLDFCLQPRFVRGVQLLAEYGLSFDLCIYPRHLPNASALVRQCPQTQFILDHMGLPDIKSGALDPWRGHLRELASLQNVWCKVSGLVTEADRQHWTPDDLAPFVAHALEAFGEDRLVFGGDWPVVLQASSYRRWVEALDALTAHLSLGAKRKLCAENARRFYRLSR